MRDQYVQSPATPLMGNSSTLLFGSSLRFGYYVVHSAVPLVPGIVSFVHSTVSPVPGTGLPNKHVP